jgi:hypothetical protein
MWGSISNFKNSVSSTMREILTDSESSDSLEDNPPTFFQPKPLVQQPPLLTRPVHSHAEPQKPLEFLAPERLAKPEASVMPEIEARPSEPVLPVRPAQEPAQPEPELGAENVNLVVIEPTPDVTLLPPIEPEAKVSKQQLDAIEVSSLFIVLDLFR